MDSGEELVIQFLEDGDVVVNGERHTGRVARMLRLLYEHQDEINSGQVTDIELSWDHDDVTGELIYRPPSEET